MNRTAIVVDDEPIIRMDLVQMMEDIGFCVTADAADGFDAVELCRAHHPDVVLLDINMPVFDGIGAAETIIQQQLAGAVVIVTAFADADFLERATTIGVTGYLIKPIEQRLLLPTIEVALAQSERLKNSQKNAEQAVQKLADMRVIDRAKALIAQEKGIAEAEAYRELQQLAMTKRCSMEQLAAHVVEKNDGREMITRAKQLLMEQRGLTEQAAYSVLAKEAKQHGKSLVTVAQTILNKGRYRE